MNAARLLLRFTSLLLAAVVAGLAGTSAQAGDRPNFLVILADDLGFSDLGCYGSEIATPTLDRLAAEGVRFTQFYNTAKCHSSRVSLMSGRWCRQAADTSLHRAVTVAEALHESGYFTAMTGKWHLQKQPTDFGFDRYFGHLSGACDYYQGDNTFRLNGQPWTVPDEGFYTTVANVDHGIEFLTDARQAEQPWMLYVAFNAPHAPLQPLKEDYERYLGRYDVGWDVIRAERVARQTKMLLFGEPVTPCDRPENIPAWDSLSPEMRDWEARRMAAYAALIDRVDQEIGRLVADLERNGELDNTLILFFSDNGACPYDRFSSGMDQEPYERGVRWSDSTGWAWVRNSPFRYYKQNQFEGGISSPAVAHWPAGIRLAPGSIVHSPAHLVDVLPTLCDLADAPIPATWPDREPTPLAGTSLAPVLKGQPAGPRPPIHLLFSSDRGLRDGDWKLVSFRSQPWELYNLAQDRTERRNVAADHPEIVQRMVDQWHEMTAHVLMAPAKEQAPVAEEATGHVHPEWTVFTSPEASGQRKKNTDTAKRQANAPGSGSRKEIRARRGTHMEVVDGQLVLDCQGDDAGLAFDQLALPDDAAGPYTLSFRLKSAAAGSGEIYWTTDARTKLPSGRHQEFPVVHDGQWQSITLEIPEPKRLYGLRLDPCSGLGEVRIEGLTLKDGEGNVLQQWP